MHHSHASRTNTTILSIFIIKFKMAHAFSHESLDYYTNFLYYYVNKKLPLEQNTIIVNRRLHSNLVEGNSISLKRHIKYFLHFEAAKKHVTRTFRVRLERQYYVFRRQPTMAGIAVRRLTEFDIIIIKSERRPAKVIQHSQQSNEKEYVQCPLQSEHLKFERQHRRRGGGNKPTGSTVIRERFLFSRNSLKC